MARRKQKLEPTPATSEEPAAPAEALTSTAGTESAPDTTAGTESPPNQAATDAPSPTGPKPFAIQSDFATGVTLREDKRFRQVQLQFRDKPGDAVRMIVREAGFTWQPTDRVWVKPIDREAGWKTRLDAERLFKEVVEEIAHEQGQTQSR